MAPKGAVFSLDTGARCQLRVTVARDTEAVAHAVVESCRTKAEIVALDEREGANARCAISGIRPAIEAGTDYGAWLHGEAVAVGMVLAAELLVRAMGFSALITNANARSSIGPGRLLALRR
jgi:3-dehydroquinate synthetase